MSEEWLGLVEFPGYLVSNCGQVASYWKNAGRGKGQEIGSIPRILKPNLLVKCKYLQVTLFRNGIRHYKKIHELVLDAFAMPRPHGMQCRHLNGRRTDNRPENLAWGTAQENADDRQIHGTQPRGSKHQNSKLTEDDVIEIKRLLKTGMTCKEIAKGFVVGTSNIKNISCGLAWKHVG